MIYPRANVHEVGEEQTKDSSGPKRICHSQGWISCSVDHPSSLGSHPIADPTYKIAPNTKATMKGRS
jgi:hypothetical protein